MHLTDVFIDSDLQCITSMIIGIQFNCFLKQAKSECLRLFYNGFKGIVHSKMKMKSSFKWRVLVHTMAVYMVISMRL